MIVILAKIRRKKGDVGSNGCVSIFIAVVFYKWKEVDLSSKVNRLEVYRIQGVLAVAGLALEVSNFNPCG